MEKTSMVWRLLWLLRTIEESPEGISGPRLATACELSLRTVYRYTKILILAGYPIEVGKKGYRVNGRMSLNAINLNLPEAFALMLASEQALGGKAPYSSTLNEAIQKILAVLPPGLRKSTRDGREHMLIGRSGPVDYSQAGNLFDLIDAATGKRAVLSIQYRGLSDEMSRRRLVNPLGLMLVGGLWYLAAYCQERKETRMFRLDRISDVKHTGETFRPPADFNLDAYMKDAWQAVRGEPVSIKIRFKGLARRLVLEGAWHASQKILQDSADFVLISFKVGGLREFASWLIAFGGEAEVLEPPELREMVVKIATAAVQANKQEFKKTWKSTE